MTGSGVAIDLKCDLSEIENGYGKKGMEVPTKMRLQ